MLERKVELEERDLGKQPLTAAELDALIGPRPHLDYLNPKNELYRARKMKDHPPTRAEAVKLMAHEPNLIKRPLLVRGQKVVYGFDEDGFRSLMAKGQT